MSRDIKIQTLEAGRERLDFGGSLGSKEFQSRADLRAYALPWIAQRTAVLAKELRELSDLQRELIGPAPLGKLLDKDE